MIIELHNMHFFAYHGYFPEERSNGNQFSVDVQLYLPDNAAIDTDHLEDTVNYQQVYDIVKREMKQPSNLLEHLAGRIHRSLLHEIQYLQKAAVTVRKHNPPLDGKVEYAAVSIS